MTKCWIKTDYVPKRHIYNIIKGKWYEVTDEGSCTFEGSEHLADFVLLKGCSYIDDRDWQVYYGDTPPDCGIQSTTLECSTSNNITQGDTNVAGSVNIPVNEVQDVTKLSLELLEDIYYAYHADDYKFGDFLDKLKSGEYSIIRNTNID